MSEVLLPRDEIVEAFRRLASRLRERGVVGEVCVFGGAAMVLAFNARDATRDVDALFEPDGVIHAEALVVARELGLPSSWLNNAGTAFLPRGAVGDAQVIFDFPNLRVSAVTARYLLVMKAHAARPLVDLADLASLIRHLDLRSVEEVASLCAEVFPDAPLSDAKKLIIEDVIASLDR